jgi:serine/threonine protein kinase
MEHGQLRSFTQQILSAVSFFHERRILHRDLKPDNILLDETRQQVKVADFGMARPFTGRRSYTARCVTAWYRPPEIILGDAQYGSAVDMWSVGCILAEMINLCPVFRCNTEFECLILAFRFLGTPTEAIWPGVSDLPNYLASFPRWPARTAESVIEVNPAVVCPGAAAMLCEMLQLNPVARVSARHALEHGALFAPEPPGGGDLNDATVVAADTVELTVQDAPDVLVQEEVGDLEEMGGALLAPDPSGGGDLNDTMVSAADTVELNEQDARDELEEEVVSDRAAKGDASSESSAPTPAERELEEPPTGQGCPAGVGPAVFVANAGAAPPEDGEGGRRLERPPASPAKRLCRGLELGGRPSGTCTAT